MEVELSVESGPSRSSTFCFGPGQEVSVGRGPGAELALGDPGLAPRHLALLLDGAILQVSDLGGGACVNGQPLARATPTEVYSGDLLEVGASVLRINVVGRGAKRRPDAGRGAAESDDEFEIVRPLGQGAAGVVFLARWRTQGNALVALKLLRDQITPGSDAHERFLRERMATRIDSPYVVKVHDARVEAKRTFLILEYVAGPSLDSLLKEGPAREVATALRIAEDVALALTAAARAAIVHRDVKPENVLLSPEGCAKLCDFGIAKGLNERVRSLTASGLGLGTMAYMPPEQISEAKHVEPSADVYSLGATLYHLLTGRPPFAPKNVEELFETVDRAPPAVASLRPDCPPEIADLVGRMLSKDPDARPVVRKVGKVLRRVRGDAYPQASFEHVFPTA